RRIQKHLMNSLMLVTALNPHMGYEKSAQISLKAYRDDLTLRDAALQFGFVTAEESDEWVRPENMTQPLSMAVDSRTMINHGGAGRTGCSLAGFGCWPASETPKGLLRVGIVVPPSSAVGARVGLAGVVVG